MKTRALLIPWCLLVLASCSAQISIETEPFDVRVPVTSLLQPVYAELAIDLPDESVNTQDLDIVVEQVAARLTVVNPSSSLTLRTAMRLSFTGKATPDDPVFYTDLNLPTYYAQAAEILPSREFAPNTTTPLRLDSPALKQAIGRRRVWFIVSNTVVRGGLTPPQLPVEIRLEDIVFEALITKPFPGLGGALENAGL
ncbi:hypothetical protein LZ198_12930 [Myxococcus sp. K15C18031901]|uniref:hypothetical protein n=1 Tax=Myxococcus dinghuensis TaxID=2906761 RepID=UPI0020A7C8D2|nr:hypothetical protein [Myxococcus dinghuensis]MCP3099771.1 hypothetical protein [Myxococcus dinghuensis]